MPDTEHPRILEPHGWISLAPAAGQAAADADHFVLTVRALSARLITGYFAEFPEKVLKAAAGLLKGMPVMLNHALDVREIVGMVLKSWWDETKIKGAPGINAEIRLDRLSLPSNLLRQMSAEPPLKCGVSVNIIGETAKSHDLDDETFWGSLGEELDGEIVREIYTGIEQIGELSLVWTGADPAARVLAKAPPKIKTERSDDMEKNANGVIAVAGLSGLAMALGVSLSTDPAAEASAVVDSLEAQAKKLAAKVDQLKPLAEQGQAHLKARRAECLRLAGLAKDGEVGDGLKKTVEGAELAAVEDMILAFGGKAAAAFTPTCPHCGKQLSAVRSSKETKEPPASGNDKYEAAGDRMAEAANKKD